MVNKDIMNKEIMNNTRTIEKIIPTMSDGSEIVRYNNINIPYYVADGNILSFKNRSAACHWHNDFEIMRIISGHMNYYINGKIIHLVSDDILIVGSKAMHYGYGEGDDDCAFVCFLADPMLLASGNTALYKKYIEPVVKSDTSYWILNKEFACHEITLDRLDEIYEINKNKPDCYEFASVRLFQECFYDFIRENTFDYISSEYESSQNLLRKMILFIHQNYSKDIKIEDIAASANISRTTCCKLFRTIQSTPIDFLNNYRLELAHSLLLNSSMSITSIAAEVGFNDSSYFTKRFKLKYGITPKGVGRGVDF